MAAPGAGQGPGASPGLEAALQKLALRRKKVLSAEEMELYELAQAAGGAMDPDVFKILLGLLKLNVAPLAVFQMLNSMCAGQRLPSECQAPAAVSLPTLSAPETRGNETSLVFGGSALHLPPWGYTLLLLLSSIVFLLSLLVLWAHQQQRRQDISGSHGAPDSSPEHPPQRLPHAASELSELAALLRLAADWPPYKTGFCDPQGAPRRGWSWGSDSLCGS
ncbi:mitotic-spindle organizing protein 2B isoform X5 [Equus caballus]|uniref:mitotic-spindle organizing protein 2B isoform X5 n=3 Tax=Equus caballus TaxID=9796 RepID=UPI0038B2B49A